MLAAARTTIIGQFVAGISRPVQRVRPGTGAATFRAVCRRRLTRAAGGRETSCSRPATSSKSSPSSSSLFRSGMVQGSEGPIVPIGPVVLDFSKQPRWANEDDSSDGTFVISRPIGLALPSYFIFPPSV